MAQYIDKDALVAEIEKRKKFNETLNAHSRLDECNAILSFIDTIKVKDPYEQCVQYDSIKAGIQAHAETYSFNIESELFNQLTKEQQKLWRKEIEQACISGGYAGVGLARDPRYKENLKVKEVDLDYIKKELDELIKFIKPDGNFGWGTLYNIATHFFELGLNASNLLTWEDVKLIWTIGDEIPYMPEEDFFKELLKRFKAQKGEKV